MEATEQIPLEADAVHIARVAELGGSSMRMAEADPFDGSLMDPLEDTLDDSMIWQASGPAQAKRKTGSCGVSKCGKYAMT